MQLTKLSVVELFSDTAKMTHLKIGRCRVINEIS